MNIIDTTEADFEKDVFEASQTTPIIVDFWAAWCGPCKSLAPILEEAIESFEGKVRLVKANTDETPKAAGEFNVQSIPSVFAVVGGEVVDFFQGVLPAEQITSWLQKILFHQRVNTAQKQIGEDAVAAEAEFREILKEQPDLFAAQIGLGEALVKQRKTDEARTLIAELETRGYLEPEAERLKAQIEFGGETTVDLDALETAADTGDVNDKFAFAKGLASAGRYEEALKLLLNVVQTSAGDDQKAAQQIMLSIFQALPEESELSRTYRRKLSTALF